MLPVIETRITDPLTGGQKGQKPQAYDLIPPDALDALASVYGWGAGKYADRNWERGYRWGLSFAALMRHAWAFWQGEELDQESGLPHMAHAAWHCFVLLSFAARGIGTDSRKILNRAAGDTAPTAAIPPA